MTEVTVTEMITKLGDLGTMSPFSYIIALPKFKDGSPFDEDGQFIDDVPKVYDAETSTIKEPGENAGETFTHELLNAEPGTIVALVQLSKAKDGDVDLVCAEPLLTGQTIDVKTAKIWTPDIPWLTIGETKEKAIALVFRNENITLKQVGEASTLKDDRIPVKNTVTRTEYIKAPISKPAQELFDIEFSRKNYKAWEEAKNSLDYFDNDTIKGAKVIFSTNKKSFCYVKIIEPKVITKEENGKTVEETVVVPPSPDKPIWNDYEYKVFGALSQLYTNALNNGVEPCFSLREIAVTMRGDYDAEYKMGKSRIGNTELENIRKTALRLSRMQICIDARDAVRNGILRQSRNFIEARFELRKINGVKTECIFVQSIPVLFDYSEQLKQVVKIENKLLRNSRQNDTDEGTEARIITIVKSNFNDGLTHYFDNLWQGDITPKQRRTKIDKVKKTLKVLKQNREITSFKIVTVGRKQVGFSFTKSQKK